MLKMNKFEVENVERKNKENEGEYTGQYRNNFAFDNRNI